ncbi:MAG: Nif3-like dinuclear metal center hexameric protein [Planctomycetaceae bacterium]|nr:Nif3-like dinuclear metal center hexameric protein [Planctomycetaceae bacterium]
MVCVGEICDYLNELAPRDLSEEWDNVGLLVGRTSCAVQRIMTCLTLTPDVADEAIEAKVQLVVTHHPVMFRRIQKISDETVEGKMLLRLIEAGIAVYSPHTGFDSARTGINQQLAESLGLTGIQPLRVNPVDSLVGAGRCGTLSESISLKELLELVRSRTGASYLEFVGSSRGQCRRIAVGCGSAAEFLRDAIALGCDTFITGEARFHSALEARSAGVTLILTGHYASERPAMEWLATELQRRFPPIESIASQIESDPLQLHTA